VSTNGVRDERDPNRHKHELGKPLNIKPIQRGGEYDVHFAESALSVSKRRGKCLDGTESANLGCCRNLRHSRAPSVSMQSYHMIATAEEGAYRKGKEHFPWPGGLGWVIWKYNVQCEYFRQEATIVLPY